MTNPLAWLSSKKNLCLCVLLVVANVWSLLPWGSKLAIVVWYNTSVTTVVNPNNNNNDNNLLGGSDSDPWVQASHDNPSYPSDIFCQRNYFDVARETGFSKKKRDHCFRRCDAYGDDGTPRNRIILAPTHDAGLNDRVFLYRILAELAGYLCADLYVPPPSLMLKPCHNNNITLSETLKTSDYLNITFHGNKHVAVLDYTEEETALTKTYLDSTYRFGTNSDGLVWKHLKSLNGTKSIFEQFKNALNHSLPSSTEVGHQHNTRFIWNIEVNLYNGAYLDLVNRLSYIERGSYPDELYLPLTDKGGPSFSLHSYTQESHIPNHIRDIAARFWDHVLKDTLDTNGGTDSYYRWAGSWHIRRGDSKQWCDTSVGKMEYYINCTFGPTSSLLSATNTTTTAALRGSSNTDSSQQQQQQLMAVMAHSEETSPKYWQGMQDSFAKHAPHVRLIVLDSAVRNFVRDQIIKDEIPFGFDNNYHTFLIVGAVVDMFAKDFRLSHRRQAHCPGCTDLSSQLLKSQQV